MTAHLQILSGFLSSIMFVSANVPMLVKALKSRSLKSYSIWNIGLNNTGNLIYWFYVVSLPVGPIWFMHSFYTITTAVMLALYIRCECGCFAGRPRRPHQTEDTCVSF